MSTNASAINLLRKSFDERQLRNASYSLSAFSRDMGISIAQLSKILNGHKSISTEHACKIAHRLELPAEEFVAFVTSTLK